MGTGGTHTGGRVSIVVSMGDTHRQTQSVWGTISSIVSMETPAVNIIVSMGDSRDTQSESSLAWGHWGDS